MLTSEETGSEVLKPETIGSVLKTLTVRPDQAIFVGNNLETDIRCANKAKVTSVRIRKGENRTKEPESTETKPKYEISKISEIFKVIEKAEKA